jgi:pimeloyl-ACP methyl ester carboxylesterase
VKRVLLVLVAIAAAVVPVQALHQAGHVPPSGPAKVRFAADFPLLIDSEWEFPIGGFGGIRRGAPLKHVPVVFVHGNTVDHADWYPVRDAFKKAGWTDQELWALAYNGLGANAGSYESQPNPERSEEHTEMGGDGVSRQTNNDTNVPDLYAFIQAVRAYTGSERFSIVSHSLGVTLARKTLKVHPELRSDLVAFVGISGANHGTSLCAPGTEGILMSCDEIAAGTAWLDELNGPDGADETYGSARWLTVYDSSGSGDIAFLGPYAESPNLKGSTAMTFRGTSHNDLRLTPEIIATYRTFIESAEKPFTAVLSGRPRAPSAPRAPAPRPRTHPRKTPGLAATGVGTTTIPAVIVLLLAAALSTRVRRRH